MNLGILLRYYTVWSFVIHYIFDDTFWVAHFVKYVGNLVAILKLIFGKGDIFETALIIFSHELPYIFKTMQRNDKSKPLLVISLLSYIFTFGMSPIYDLYMNVNVIQHILK